MKRGLAFVYVLGVFLLGGAIGALAMHLYHAGQVPEGPPFGRHGAGPGSERGPAEIGRLLRLLDSRNRFDFLELTTEQKASIATILEDARSEMDAVRRDLRPRMEQHARETRSKIDAVLSVEQRQKLDESLAREPPSGRRRGRRPPPD